MFIGLACFRKKEENKFPFQNERERSCKGIHKSDSDFALRIPVQIWTSQLISFCLNYPVELGLESISFLQLSHMNTFISVSEPLVQKSLQRAQKSQNFHPAKKAVFCFEQGQVQMFQRNLEFLFNSLRFVNLHEGYEQLLVISLLPKHEDFLFLYIL